MSRLKLGPIEDDKPVRLTIDLPPAVHRDLLTYSKAYEDETGQLLEPARLVPPMLAKFMGSDRGFARAKRACGAEASSGEPAEPKPERSPNSSSPASKRWSRATGHASDGNARIGASGVSTPRPGAHPTSHSNDADS